MTKPKAHEKTAAKPKVEPKPVQPEVEPPHIDRKDD